MVCKKDCLKAAKLVVELVILLDRLKVEVKVDQLGNNLAIQKACHNKSY